MRPLSLPTFGHTMQTGTVVDWHVEEGDAFEVGDVLYTVDTEKSTVDVEAKQDGVLARIVTDPGAEVPTGTLLAVVAQPGEPVDGEAVERVIREAADSADEADAEPDRSGVAPSVGQAHDHTRTRASPRARRLAGELSVDLAAVNGTGPDGAVTVEDLQAAGGDMPRIRERRTLHGVRKAMAEQMIRSWQVPQFSQDITVDVTNLRMRRKQLREEGVEAGVTDLLIDVVVAAVVEVPEVNAVYRDGEIVLYESVNVAVAVATDAGLVVPVLRDCQDLALPERIERRRALTNRARDGELAPEDSTNATISVSNLGMTAVETGVPLVNAPQVCTVFAGRAVDKPVAVGDGIEVRPVMHVVIAYDHRVVDGAVGARFTTAVRDGLEGRSAQR